MKHKYLYGLLAIIFILIPIGLLAQNPAWGEWELDYFKNLLGFIPEGMEKNKDMLNPIIPDYVVSDKSPVFSYYLSGIVGVVVIYIIFSGLKFILKNER